MVTAFAQKPLFGKVPSGRRGEVVQTYFGYGERCIPRLEQLEERILPTASPLPKELLPPTYTAALVQPSSTPAAPTPTPTNPTTSNTPLSTSSVDQAFASGAALPQDSAVETPRRIPMRNHFALGLLTSRPSSAMTF